MTHSVAMLEAQELFDFVEVCLEGHQFSGQAVQFVDVLRDLDTGKTFPKLYATQKDYEIARVRASRMEKVAKSQAEDGFPMLYNLAVVRLLTIVEAAVERFVLAALADPAKLKDQKIIRSLQGSLVDFSELPQDQRPEYLYNALKDSLRPRRHTGIGRYEILLDSVGLGGGVPEGVRCALFELIEVRNLIVHRAAIVDPVFVSMCGWLKVSVGNCFNVSKRRFLAYILSSNWYFLELERRSGNAAALTERASTAMKEFEEKVAIEMNA